MLAARLSRSVRVNDDLLERVSRFIGWVLVAYLYLRFWDALAMTYTYLPGRTEGLRVLTSGPLAVNFWLVELALGGLVPAVVLLWPALRRQPRLRMLALALVVVGVVIYRWDVNLVGQMVQLSYMPQAIVARYTEYTPSMVELVSAAGIVAFGLAAFSLGVRHLNVVDHAEHGAHAAEGA
jgi:molybdopterin-containing oxidoreductase family membrane subunit